MKNFTVVAMFGAVFLTALAVHLDGAAADSGSCAGSTLCPGLAQSDCDAARRQMHLDGAADESWSCAGSTLCRNLPQSDCDSARRLIQPTNRYFTGGDKGSTGVCSGHCGLFVSEPNCDLTGNEMIIAFDELRSRDCQKCGIKTYNDGCKFKADYVSGC